MVGKKTITLLLLGISCFTYAQKIETSNSYFMERAYMFGKVMRVNNGFSFPQTTFQQVAALNIGSVNKDTNQWGKYYNFPETGVMLFYSNLGNNEILGHQLGILPFVSFRILNQSKSPLQLKLGAGISYFTHHFDSIQNNQNELIGSHLNWDVKVFVYKSIHKKNGNNLKLGFGFSHESNGHTKLPNLGVNSLLVSISSQFFNQKKDNFFQPVRVKRQNISSKKYYITFEEGLGFHEQDETEGPVMGELKPVYSTDLSAAILFNKHIKLRGGFTYRYYQTYYDHITNNNIPNLSEHPNWNSSNMSFYLGNEFLMGHVSIDAILGFNWHKPFYQEFNQDKTIIATLQRKLLTRVGANLYLINTHKLPKHNIFIGTHIKANMMKADYTDLTIGYTFNIN